MQPLQVFMHPLKSILVQGNDIFGDIYRDSSQLRIFVEGAGRKIISRNNKNSCSLYSAIFPNVRRKRPQLFSGLRVFFAKLFSHFLPICFITVWEVFTSKVPYYE
jgi:hypothetical protein